MSQFTIEELEKIINQDNEGLQARLEEALKQYSVIHLEHTLLDDFTFNILCQVLKKNNTIIYRLCCLNRR